MASASTKSLEFSTGNKQKTVQTALREYTLPAARSQGNAALLLWVAVMLVLLGICYGVSFLRTFASLVLLWWVVSMVVAFFWWPRNELKTLQVRGAQYSINARQHPRLKTLLARGSALVGIREPEGYTRLSDDIGIRAAANPAYLSVGQGALKDIEPPELDCLTIRCLVQLSMRYAGRLYVIRRLEEQSRSGRFLLWPVALYASLLRSMWLAPAEESADRLTLLLVKNPRLLSSSIIKQFVASNPVLLSKGVKPADVAIYMKQSVVGEKGEDIAVQYAIGNAIREDVPMSNRLRAITTWVNTPEYVAALEKLATGKK